MNKKTILVTGGLGFIGSHTVVALQEAGYEVIIIDNLSNSFAFVLDGIQAITGIKSRFYEGDCNDRAFMQSVFGKEKIDGVIHFAAYKAVGESVAEPLKYYHNNLMSLIVLLELMQAHAVPHLVFSSSCTVYGQPKQLPVDESAPILPAQSPYGNTKQICEEIIRDSVQAGMPVKALALRYFNPIGAHPTAHIGELPIGVPNNLVPYITQTAAGIRRELSIFGNDYNTPDGTCIRDFIHVMDLAEAHVKALECLLKQPAAPLYDFVNIGTGKGHSVLEVVQTFERVNNLQLPYKFAPRRPGDVEQIYAKADKAKQMLGWQARRSLDEALRDAWQWQKALKEKGILAKMQETETDA
ncbi:MAG: UDP-glucose 4-epimerase [Thermonema sp.]|uniref:UDP-glucose 4-epimerase GalE n=1 Tax=Thermonema sp. TaxID=2231181 RepID=UPI0021DD0BD1|nr:UDP-glucose 4-epimerase GalE [Thermonema sp.]GIV40590.1 MAG: UDP-glucose 4-epimerase [Thermonema sp.]